MMVGRRSPQIPWGSKTINWVQDRTPHHCTVVAKYIQILKRWNCYCVWFANGGNVSIFMVACRCLRSSGHQWPWLASLSKSKAAKWMDGVWCVAHLSVLSGWQTWGEKKKWTVQGELWSFCQVSFMNKYEQHVQHGLGQNLITPKMDAWMTES